MCRHIITHHECDHTTIREYQCDQALSPFATIFCKDYVVLKHMSHTTRCHGQLCKDDAQTKWLRSANDLKLGLSNLEHDMSLYQNEQRRILERSMNSGPLQREREKPRLKFLVVELEEMREQRAKMRKELRDITESAYAANKATILGKLQTMASTRSSWTGQNQVDHATAVASLTAPNVFRPMQQPLDASGRAIYTPTPIHVAVTPAPRLRHAAQPFVSRPSPLRTPAPNYNPMPYQVSFSAATDSGQSSSQAITTPLDVPKQLHKGLYASPTVPAASTPLSAAQKKGTARPKGARKRKTPKADTTWQDTTKQDMASSSMRRSGRLSIKRKVSYTEFSDDELSRSPSHAALSLSNNRAGESLEGTSMTRTNTRGSKRRRINRDGKDDYEDDASDWERHNETDVDTDNENVYTISVDPLPKTGSTRSTRPAMTQVGNAPSQHQMHEQRSTNLLENPKIREALQKLESSGFSRTTPSHHGKSFISATHNTEQSFPGTEALRPTVRLQAPQAPMYPYEKFYPSTPVDKSKLSPQAAMPHHQITYTQAGGTVGDVRHGPLLSPIQVSQPSSFTFQGGGHDISEPI